MTWLDETEPFELKETISRKRIAQGVLPRLRKWKDKKRRLFARQYRNWPFLRSRGAKKWRRRNGSKWWGEDRDAWRKPNEEDKSSRQRMRLIEEWWEDVHTD